MSSQIESIAGKPKAWIGSLFFDFEKKQQIVDSSFEEEDTAQIATIDSATGRKRRLLTSSANDMTPRWIVIKAPYMEA